MAGTIAPEVVEPLPVVTKSFEEARQKVKKSFSDTFIDGALDGTLTVGGDKVFFIKSYFDQVPMTPRDKEVMRDPERIAAMYRETSEMVLRNLRVFRATNASPERAAEITSAKEAYLQGLARQIPAAEKQIVGWCADKKQQKYPLAATEYHGFNLNGSDILNAGAKSPGDVEPNFKIQRQLGGTFIMAYSDTRVAERRSAHRDEEPDRRIYLNPEIEATPRIFAQILQIANEKGVKVQLKMLQRATELATAHQSNKSGGREKNDLRGDGIVLYVNHRYEDQVLRDVLAIVEQNAAVFRGRGVSRIPVKIADGVALGDEPAGVKGRESLTSHRSMLIERALAATRQSGLSGPARRDFFHQEFRKIARQHQVNPDNFAFNA